MAFDDGIGNNQYVPYWPTEDYINPTKRNKGTPWGAMQVPVDSLRALARSEAIANVNGILDRDTSKYYLPSALVEGRWNDYGVNNVDVNYRSAPPKAIQSQIKQATDYDQQLSHLSHIVDKQKDQEAATKLFEFYKPTINALEQQSEKYKKSGYDDRVWGGNQDYNSITEVANRLGIRKRASQEIENGAKYDRYYPIFDQTGNGELSTPNDYHTNAALKTLALYNKVKESGKTGLDAWERYNGDGPDARQYRKKIEATHDLMSHPKNKDFYNLYRNLVKNYENELKNAK